MLGLASFYHRAFRFTVWSEELPAVKFESIGFDDKDDDGISLCEIVYQRTPISSGRVSAPIKVIWHSVDFNKVGN